MAANKLTNGYVQSIDADVYDRIPKAVWAAIAISLATCGGDFLDEATSAILKEWDTLHVNGIVPQMVPPPLVGLIKTDE